MPKVSLHRLRIKEGREGRIRSWYDELMNRKNEVRETLEHEGVLTESAFILSTEGDSYLYIFMEAEDLDGATSAGQEEEFEIDAEHHDVLRENLTGEGEEIESIAHFINPGRR